MDDVVIVAGYDGSPGGRAALVYALEDAARRGGRVRVVWAFPRPEYWAEAYGLSMQVELPDLVTRLEARAREAVDEIVEQDPRLADVPVEVRAVCGGPGRVLVDAATEATELVVGHRGLGGVASALVGSVGLHCVLHAACPVTVTRPVPQAARESQDFWDSPAPAFP